MEQANKYIPHTRTKRSGAWWVPSGNAMLGIRCAMYAVYSNRALKNTGGTIPDLHDSTNGICTQTKGHVHNEEPINLRQMTASETLSQDSEFVVDP